MSCVTSVKNAIQELDGVDTVEVNLKEGTANVNYDEKKVDTKLFTEAVESVGYGLNGINL